MTKLRRNQRKFTGTHEIKFNSIQDHVKDFGTEHCRMNTPTFQVFPTHINQLSYLTYTKLNCTSKEPLSYSGGGNELQKSCRL